MNQNEAKFLDWTVSEVLGRYPQTATVFLHHRLSCVGCEMAPFETLAEVVSSYNLEGTGFLDELQAAIGK